MIKAGIVGVSGYGGAELFRILHNHPNVSIEAISSRSYDGKNLHEVYPHLRNYNIKCKNYLPSEIANICDVVFTAVPHGGPAMEYAKPINKLGKKLIDLSADFRFKNLTVYEKWYTKHQEPELLKQAVYGLPEINKDNIKNAWLIGNPGCYTTAAILSNIPVLKEKIVDPHSIIIDSKSGASGAGRKAKQPFHYPELNEGFKAYAVTSHRHTPEIEEQLSFATGESIKVTFTPHLVPMTRGILSVSYSRLLTNAIEEKKIIDLYKDFYTDKPFVRILDDILPNTKYVSGSNFIDISIKIDKRTNIVIIIAAIDNLIKGASGQAVQNMNLMFGLNETEGLQMIPLYP